RAADAENAGLSWPANNLGGSAYRRGRRETALKLWRRTLALQPHDPTFTRQAAAEAQLVTEGAMASIMLDHATQLDRRLANAHGDNLGAMSSRESLVLPVAEARAAAHEGARGWAEAAGFEPQRPADVLPKAVALWRIAWLRQDWQAILDAEPPSSAPATLAVRGEALVRLGRLAEAQALVATFPLDCQPCALDRAWLAEARGERALADQWFSEASRIAPSLPSGPLAWGQTLLARGVLDKAERQFQDALRRSPRAEEALEALGELRLAKDDAGAAGKHFAAALKLTPKWGRAHLKWGEALAKLGKADQARAHFAVAAGLDLTPTERA